MRCRLPAFGQGEQIVRPYTIGIGLNVFGTVRVLATADAGLVSARIRHGCHAVLVLDPVVHLQPG